MTGDEENALSAGCDGYLTKPIDTRTFASTIESFINKSKQTANTLDHAD
jgi:CheY-like chemotaxis protein